jgi:hypothetical protein
MVLGVLATILVSGKIPYETYIYTGERIIRQSWHDIVRVIIWIFLAIIAVSGVWLSVLKIIEMVKQEKKNVCRIAWKVIQLLFLWVIIFVVLFVISSGLYFRFTARYEGNTYYEFSDGNHTIVIEEELFFFSGEFSVFQINEDNTAILIGGEMLRDVVPIKNNINIEWFDEYVIIAYNDGKARTLECKFK